MSDESLDNFFKKRLSERNVAFNMESWRKMEQMLPVETKPAGFKLGSVAAVIGALFVVSTSLLVLKSTDLLSTNSEQIAQNTSITDNDKTDNQSIGDSVESNKLANNTNESNNEASGKVLTSDKKSTLSNKQKQLETKENNYASNNKGANKTKKNHKGLLSMNNKAKTKGNNLTKSSNSFFAANDGFESLNINEESAIAFEAQGGANNFTEIVGLEEIKTFDLEQDEQTLFAEIGNSKLPKVKANELGFIGGFGLSKSLVESGNSNAINVNGVFGVSYQHYFNGGFSLMTNLLYAPRTGVNAVKYYDKKTIYGWGSHTEQQVVDCQKMVYLELPIMVNYNVGNHNFMAGPSLAYLVTSKLDVSTIYENKQESIVDNSTTWGYTDGFNKLDVAIVTGYEYNFKSNFNVGLRLNYGLTDITNNQYFGADSFDNNIQFRVYLKYSPFNF